MNSGECTKSMQIMSTSITIIQRNRWRCSIICLVEKSVQLPTQHHLNKKCRGQIIQMMLKRVIQDSIHIQIHSRLQEEVSHQCQGWSLYLQRVGVVVNHRKSSNRIAFIVVKRVIPSNFVHQYKKRLICRASMYFKSS